MPLGPRIIKQNLKPEDALQFSWTRLEAALLWLWSLRAALTGLAGSAFWLRATGAVSPPSRNPRTLVGVFLCPLLPRFVCETVFHAADWPGSPEVQMSCLHLPDAGITSVYVCVCTHT